MSPPVLKSKSKLHANVYIDTHIVLYLFYDARTSSFSLLDRVQLDLVEHSPIVPLTIQTMEFTYGSICSVPVPRWSDQAIREHRGREREKEQLNNKRRNMALFIFVCRESAMLEEWARWEMRRVTNRGRSSSTIVHRPSISFRDYRHSDISRYWIARLARRTDARNKE